jgi:protein-S-isoprenylcysteine O-methyltransferase Ste14
LSRDAGKILARLALGGVARFQAVLAVLIFLPAWSVRFFEGWLYWLVFFACALALTLYFLKHDPGLIASRLKVGPRAEREASQKKIQAAGSVALCSMYITAGLDHRFQWSAVPLQVALGADVLVGLGYLLIFFVFKANSHASSIIEVKPDQQVISTGPYRWVRHPMYAGVILFVLASPLALGSLWALICAALLCFAMAVRLLAEERFLAINLPGYAAYRATTRYRLIPGIW